MTEIFTFLVGQSCRSALDFWAAQQPRKLSGGTARPTDDVRVFVLHRILLADSSAEVYKNNMRSSPRWLAISAVIIAALLARSTSAQTWTNTSLIAGELYPVACSGDGTVIITAQSLGEVCFSTNSGGNWTNLPSPTTSWYTLACSADGSKLFAGGGGCFLVSTNSGLTWATNTAQFVNAEFTCIACSADGTRVAVAGGIHPAGILCSTDSGTTFITNAVPTGYFGSIVSSADGTKLVGMFGLFRSPGTPDSIYRSVDWGITWTLIGAPTSGEGYTSVACSADGTTIAAVDGDYGISTNSGVSWETSPAPYAPSVIACSADGTRLITAGPYGLPPEICTSLNSGQTWTTNNVPGDEWRGLAMSADGSVLIGAASPTGSSYGDLFIAHIPAQPSLSIVPSGSNLTLSWPLPSAGFVLQLSADLTSTHWLNVTNTVAASGYYNQVTVPPPATGNAYYRLVKQ